MEKENTKTTELANLAELVKNFLLNKEQTLSEEEKQVILEFFSIDLETTCCFSEGETTCQFANLNFIDESKSEPEFEIVCEILNLVGYAHNGEELTMSGCPLKKLKKIDPIK